MRADLRRFENPAPGRPLGKVVVRPETPEDLAELDAFRRHVGRDHGGDKLEIVFFEKRARREAAAPGAEAEGRGGAVGE